ncbi:hypothetical protein DPMN_068911 [Dreissena polymorpha]|uniref:Uncharacterized protein n=1 Tax=Dreissena polymorpha TaxID=45954 RepID=A0A9D3YY23_DREPO|nr:hypothetical protein DPMN_068911 [Dreissena polymorpha]
MLDEWDTIARENAMRFEENGGVYYNTYEKVKHMKISVKELKKIVLSKTMDYYDAEFQVIRK